MSDINKTILIGRMVRDAELKSTANGINLCKFTIVVNTTVKRGDDYQDEPNFIDCIAWGKTAEIISKHVLKGHRIGVDGSLKFSSWENAEGKKQSKIEVNVERFQFLQPKDQIMQPKEPTESFSDPFNDDTPF